MNHSSTTSWLVKCFELYESFPICESYVWIGLSGQYLRIFVNMRLLVKVNVKILQKLMSDFNSRVENTFCIPGDSWKRFPQVHLFCRIDREFSLKECTINKPLINHHFKTPFYLLLNWNIVYGPNNKGICIYIIQFNPITCVL